MNLEFNSVHDLPHLELSIGFGSNIKKVEPKSQRSSDKSMLKVSTSKH